jgi:hypothetical protein
MEQDEVAVAVAAFADEWKQDNSVKFRAKLNVCIKTKFLVLKNETKLHFAWP